METHGCGRLYRMRFVPSSACNIENKINSAGKPQRSIHTCAIIFIARQRSCGKVMFSQVCLVNGRGEGVGVAHVTIMVYSERAWTRPGQPPPPPSVDWALGYFVEVKYLWTFAILCAVLNGCRTQLMFRSYDSVHTLCGTGHGDRRCEWVLISKGSFRELKRRVDPCGLFRISLEPICDGAKVYSLRLICKENKMQRIFTRCNRNFSMILV